MQTTRIAVNSFEEWLLPAVQKGICTLDMAIDLIVSILESIDIGFFNIGPCRNLNNIATVVPILSKSGRISSSILFPKEAGNGNTLLNV